jgi:hypothetical protein
MIGRNLEPKKAAKVLAKTMYKELKKMNFTEADIIDFSREIINHMAIDIQNNKQVSDIEKIAA